MLSVRLRFLQTQRRTVETLVVGTTDRFAPVDELEVDHTLHVAWDEAVERVVDIDAIALRVAGETSFESTFAMDGAHETEEIRSVPGATVGRFLRRREAIAGRIVLQVTQPDAPGGYLKVSVTVENATPWDGIGGGRDDAMGHSLVAVHAMLAIEDGRFISLLDPPDDAADAARSCRSDGSYPVLIGDDDVVLSSPIILYDHPEVAPQSPGDLYDSLEIDEILALRVMTLTDEEKAETRGTDPRAAAIIERCDNMSAETLSQLHGQMRHVDPLTDSGPAPQSALDPWWNPAVDAEVDPWSDSTWVGGTEVSKGSAVRLHPSQRADAQDMFFEGLTATVAGVFLDVDGETHVAVSVDDDPATAELMWQGRYLFFRPDELEPLHDREPSR
jgi:hypothetical protein